MASARPTTAGPRRSWIRGPGARTRHGASSPTGSKSASCAGSAATSRPARGMHATESCALARRSTDPSGSSWECRSVRLAFVSTPADTRVAVLVLDGAKALDVGIAAHVFAKRESMPYEVRVCGERATVEGWNGLGYAVAHGLEALAWADTVLVPGYRNPAEAVTSDAVVGALRAAH